ncbi:MAG: hypothetical protein OXE84_13055 [Rhodobacteraceae bacterium]|nr:hypothetical protein [Paracoccaceae bacterium]
MTTGQDVKGTATNIAACNPLIDTSGDITNGVCPNLGDAKRRLQVTANRGEPMTMTRLNSQVQKKYGCDWFFNGLTFRNMIRARCPFCGRWRVFFVAATT